MRECMKSTQLRAGHKEGLCYYSYTQLVVLNFIFQSFWFLIAQHVTERYSSEISFPIVSLPH